MTALKTILAHLDGQERGAQTLSLACRLARQFDAHPCVVFAAPVPMLAASAMDPAAAVVLEYQAQAQQALENTARAQLAAAEATSGLAIEWRMAGSDLVAGLALHARHGDLMLMGQEDPERTLGFGGSLPVGVILGAGRPVLLVPYAGRFEGGFNSVLIAWNGGRESARAIADALPLLQTAKKVNIVSFNPKDDADWGEIPGADIGLWLARHGVRVTVQQSRSAEVDVGNQILSMAADLGSDLIVMGAYGHSRAMEWALGGVTRTILQSMTVPVLFSH